MRSIRVLVCVAAVAAAPALAQTALAQAQQPQPQARPTAQAPASPSARPQQPVAQPRQAGSGAAVRNAPSARPARGTSAARSTQPPAPPRQAVISAPATTMAANPQPMAGRAFGCDRPGRPVLPTDLASQGQLDQARTATIDYFRNADAYRACLDRYITAERDKMFRDNTPETPELKAAAGEHSGVSQEKAAVFERFVLLCYAWEDRNRRPFPAGCALPANPT